MGLLLEAQAEISEPGKSEGQLKARPVTASWI
jgi:hypothetical protein